MLYCTLWNAINNRIKKSKSINIDSKIRHIFIQIPHHLHQFFMLILLIEVDYLLVVSYPRISGPFLELELLYQQLWRVICVEAKELHIFIEARRAAFAWKKAFSSGCGSLLWGRFLWIFFSGTSDRIDELEEIFSLLCKMSSWAIKILHQAWHSIFFSNLNTVLCKKNNTQTRIKSFLTISNNSRS